MQLRLNEVKGNKKLIISKILAQGELGKRIRDLGITPGTEIKVVGKAPLKDPIMVKFRNTVLALRNNEAGSILVDMAKENNEN